MMIAPHLSRNLMDCMNIVKELRNLEHPVGILFETENMYTLGENMDFTIQILSLVAQEESHRCSSMDRIWVGGLQSCVAERLWCPRGASGRDRRKD